MEICVEGKTKKRILILAPHQDDEVILCGSFLKRMVKNAYDIYVVFMTNGDYEEGIGTVRLRESLEVMRLYGIQEDHVFFMGYANEYDKKGPHIYNARPGQLVYSQFGNAQTYGLPEHPEYCFGKYGSHHKYIRENVVADLTDILKELYPDVIFATDVEIHPDHKANSLFLDEVLGNIFKRDKEYRPIIFKKPEYYTAWFGPDDYSFINNPCAQKVNGRTFVNCQPTQFCNPYIRWKDRIRLPVDDYSRKAVNNNNIVYQALKCYRSQNAVEHFEMLLNNDVVFWQRRTDSLTYRSQITTSSGDAEFLNDFKIIDSCDIARKSIDAWYVDASVWRPSDSDKEPWIKIALEDAAVVSEIVIYQEFCPKSEILKSRLIFDRKESIEVGKLEKRKPTVVRFTPRKTRNIEYKIEQCSDSKTAPGIMEIEVYPEQKKKLVFIKLMINGEFVYDYFLENISRRKMEVYELYRDGSSIITKDWSRYHIYVHEGEKKTDKFIEVISREDKNIKDQIHILRKTRENKKIYFIGTPNHHNTGDHVIAFATDKLLKELFPFTEIVEISVDEFDKKLWFLKKTIRKQDLIVLQGGGNMGNIYWRNERIRRIVIRNFSENKMIIFPETIFYEKNSEGRKDYKYSKKIYKKARELTICAREKQSYRIMKAAYPENKVILTPDIACYLSSHLEMDRKQVKLFFRNDLEKSISGDLEKRIRKILDEEQLDYMYKDMLRFQKGHMGRANRKETVRYKFREFASARLVITDRLHAMILSAITGTPCLAIAKYNHKIGSTYHTWFSELPSIELMTDEKDLEQQIHRLLSLNTKSFFEVGNKFAELINCMEEWKNE